MNEITRTRTVIGSYRNLAGADIRVVDHSESDGNILTPIVTAHCGGHGCAAVAPISRPSAGTFLSMVDRAEEVTRAAEAVQGWAQEHAATCRANAAPGPHPAERDLPTCGKADPESGHACQLTAGHDWRHAAYTGGSYGLRHQWEAQDV